MNSVTFRPPNRDLTLQHFAAAALSSTRRHCPPWRVSLDTRPAASRAADLRRSRLGDMAKTMGRCAAKKVRSRRPPRRVARGGETRARRSMGTLRYAQSALLPRPSARSFAHGPISPSFKKFTHTPLPLYLAAARRAQVDGRSSSTRVPLDPSRRASRHTSGARACAHRLPRTPPFPTPNGGFCCLPST